jgi:hypothetical protein
MKIKNTREEEEAQAIASRYGVPYGSKWLWSDHTWEVTGFHFDHHLGSFCFTLKNEDGREINESVGRLKAFAKRVDDLGQKGKLMLYLLIGDTSNCVIFWEDDDWF